VCHGRMDGQPCHQSRMAASSRAGLSNTVVQLLESANHFLTPSVMHIV
jgi:hypothetical protein